MAFWIEVFENGKLIGYRPGKIKTGECLWEKLEYVLDESINWKTPGIVKWISRLEKEGCIWKKQMRLNMVGVVYGDKNMAFKDTISQSIKVSSEIFCPGNLHKKVLEEVQLVGDIKTWIGKIAFVYAKSNGYIDPAIKSREMVDSFLFHVENPFNQWIAFLCSGNEKEHIEKKNQIWNDRLKDISKSIIEERIEDANASMIAGRMRKFKDKSTYYSVAWTTKAFQKFLDELME